MSTTNPAVADLDAGTITRSVHVNASVDTVFETLTSSDAIEQWWGHPNEFPGGIVAGSEGVFHWQDITFPVRIDEVSAPHRFVLTWGSGQDIDGEATQVAFTVEPDGDGSKVTVLESGFDRMSEERRSQQVRDNVSGWNAVLDSFVNHVEALA